MVSEIGKRVLTKLRRGKEPENAIRTAAGMEPVYRDLFLREIGRCGVPDTFYPVGPAANHSFMYFVARVLQDHRFTDVLDLGAGQVSILIDRIRQKTGNFTVRTVEHDPFWAEKISSQVSHEVICAPLAARRVHEHQIRWYDLPPSVWRQPVDLLIVDGPPAHDGDIRYARIGALDIAAAVLQKDFVVVVDDSERAGEQALIRMLKALFQQRGIAFSSNTLHAYKCQTILAAGQYRDAVYY
jgi:hypothetical protein